MKKRVERPVVGLKPVIQGETGINLDVPGRALAAQAAERAVWHKQNAEAIAAELKALGGDSQPGEPDHWKRITRQTDLTRRLREHEEHARFLNFIKRHINRRRVYRVSLHDLSELEIAPKALYL